MVPGRSKEEGSREDGGGGLSEGEYEVVRVFIYC